MVNASRRSFLKTMAAGLAGAELGLMSPDATAQILGQRPHQADGVRVGTRISATEGPLA